MATLVLTPAEEKAWGAYLQEGSVKRAAESLGVHEQTVKRHLANIRSRLGVISNAQAAHILARQLRM